MWKGLKDCLLEETEAVCGKAKARARHKITWWWNKETDRAAGRREEHMSCGRIQGWRWIRGLTSWQKAGLRG